MGNIDEQNGLLLQAKICVYIERHGKISMLQPILQVSSVEVNFTTCHFLLSMPEK